MWPATGKAPNFVTTGKTANKTVIMVRHNGRDATMTNNNTLAIHYTGELNEVKL
jgi:FKBP-type peptidyl-prolyl cis-trans isomerase